MNSTKIALAIAVTSVMVAAAVSPTLGQAFAKITPGTPPSCTNGGGNQPGGQQPTCTGQGLIQDPGTSATNPAGHAPPGQQ